MSSLLFRNQIFPEKFSGVNHTGFGARWQPALLIRAMGLQETWKWCGCEVRIMAVRTSWIGAKKHSEGQCGNVLSPLGRRVLLLECISIFGPQSNQSIFLPRYIPELLFLATRWHLIFINTRTAHLLSHPASCQPTSASASGRLLYQHIFQVVGFGFGEAGWGVAVLGLECPGVCLSWLGILLQGVALLLFGFTLWREFLFRC